MAELLVEVGTEELPPAAIAPALEQLTRDARAALEAACLDVDDVRTTGTVRRLVLIADGVAARQRDRVTEVRGPAAKVAYDAAGRPTQAAQGFARSQGVPAETLKVRDIEGGRYVVAEIREAGRPAINVLGDLLAGVLAGLDFPKTMRWDAGAFRFGRPIRWIVALLDRRVIPVEIAGLRSGRRTVGHRFLAPGSITLSGASAHRAAMKKAHVMLDPKDRRERIVNGARALASRLGGRPILAPALLDELVWSTEHPTPLPGTLDANLIAGIPRPVVLVTLQHHQKSFGMEDAGGRLMPAFIAVRDGGISHVATVRTGHEWVVRARLADARFFLEEDRRGTFEQWNAALSNVTYLAGLGSMADHVQRVARVAEWLREGSAPSASPDGLARAAALCKADLVTAMVREFPELQGTMGGIYARWAGEPEAVAAGIEEHYMPRGAGDTAPANLLGALLAIADRAVLLARAVHLGVSGSQDPFGLRRAATGIIVVLQAHSLSVSMKRLLSLAATGAPESDDPVVRLGIEIVRSRLRNMLTDQGIAYDTIDAVLAAGRDDVVDLVARARALHAVRAEPVMARLATGFSRVSRILSQGSPGSAVDESLLAEPAEVNLYRTWQAVRTSVERDAGTGRYREALQTLARLAGPIDVFFNDVLVMAPDPALRGNRLALLAGITASFLRVADFSKLAG